MAANKVDDGSEPINFRAALAAFQKKSATSDAPSASNLHSPRPRPLQPASGRQPPQTPARPSSGLDPVSRSSSTPRIRNNSDGLISPSSNNPFASKSSLHPSSAVPSTSASGMQSGPSSAGQPSIWPTLRRTGSGVSLNELTERSVPLQRVNGYLAHTLPRSRSRSIIGNEPLDPHSNGGSASSSGRSSPYVPSRAIHGLFPDDADSHFSQTVGPPTTQHMLDTSADDAMFAHAVMERSAPLASPRTRDLAESDSYLLPPQVPSRKGSASSGHSTAASIPSPRLPPRPAAANALAPSPTISEFGQFPASSSGSATAPSRAKTGLAYATYTPGAKRNAQGQDTGATPPALPPRSATLGQADRTPLRTEHGSPVARRAPTIPRKPVATPTSAMSKPMPPPRPAKVGEGTAPEKPASASQPPPPPRQRTISVQSHRGFTNAPTPGVRTHRKSGSNVFTSISLSDDASVELKRSLESDIHDAPSQQLPPPTRGKPGTFAALPASARASFSSTASGNSGAGGVVSSLIGSAASAIPLFKSSSPFSGTRSLADGAPSKQPYFSGGVAVSRSASAHSELSGEGEAALWGAGRTVQLADETSVVSKTQGGGLLREPKDGSARRRYEALFDELLVRQRSKKRVAKDSGPSSNASTIRDASTGAMERKPSGGVQALRGWFESDPATNTGSSTTAPSLQPAPVVTDTLSDSPTTLSRKTVHRIWSRSRLPASLLGRVWDQAASSAPGLEKEPFTRAMAAIDAELERKKHRRETRRARQSKPRNRESTTGSARRMPPPPPAAAAS
ncbi:EF-hand domain pair [Kalmanozyma brasiliensis GHG001]|uniref:EF-hand domain pair n=1 Tax=Kalmanozyma brasiliensis (strain GHG001) TaxID=1365824 RepID=UPI002867D035|nr:EF-hand domain pair [Kalmanozyma brasiliensis GHG001]KAF6767098.1 EF-hand domain pair [Kalmanozyma brasiliensis GHG001]